MIRARKLVLAALVLAAGIAGCGEVDQVIVYKQGKYQGKTDAQPWSNDPAAGSKWTKGDKSSWEAAIKSRNQHQNEYARAE